MTELASQSSELFFLWQKKFKSGAYEGPYLEKKSPLYLLEEELWRMLFEWHFLDSYLNEDVSECVLGEDTHENFIELQMRSSAPLKAKILPLPNFILELLADYLSYQKKVPFNAMRPFQSFRARILQREVRVGLVHPSVTKNHYPKIFIRWYLDHPPPLSDFSDAATVKFLKTSMEQRKTILVAGASGQGKTTFLRSLLEDCQNEHIVTLEDTEELRLSNSKEKNRFITSFLEGPLEKQSLSDFCEYLLRITPDRVVLGEVRSREVFPFFQLINVGLRGALASVHANSARDAIDRLLTLLSLSSGEQKISLSESNFYRYLCQNIDLIVFIKDRKIAECASVIGYDGRSVILSSFKKTDTTGEELKRRMFK